MMKTGGEILIDCLIENGTYTIFGVPGESYLDALNALHDRKHSIRFITCRQEGGAAYMADAFANATGKTGICFVTRGPGVTNASIGLHTAYQGSTPMILLIGQIPRAQAEREVFQEIDYRQMLGPVTKWVAQIDDVDRIPEFMARAFAVANSGRPGPVALALPEDMLRDLSDVQPVRASPITSQIPDPAAIINVKALLQDSKQPVLILGGSQWTPKAREAIHQFATRNHIPVATGFRRHSLYDNRSANYIGNLGFGSFQSLVDYVGNADLILAVGSRLADATVRKYTLVKAPKPDQKLVHVLTDPNELGRVLTPDVAICSDMESFATAANEAIAIDTPPWKQICQSAAKAFQDALELPPQPIPVNMGEIMAWMRENLPQDAILTNGAGNYADWPNKMFTYRAPRTTLAPISGAMGYSVPAAVAAKIAFPDRTVIGFAGDGDYLMNGQELATAVQYGANPIILVINNSSYGTIRVHQEKNYPGRVSGTDLVNPDFSALAKSFGAVGETINSTEEFYPAFARALNCIKATVIEINVGPKSFGPATVLN